MALGRYRLPYCLFDESIVAVGKNVAALIAVEGWGESADSEAFSYPPFVPIGLSGNDFEIVHAEMVLSIGSMLHNGGFKKSGCRLGGGKVFGVS